MSKISHLAIIEDGAKIGSGVEIAANCFISKDATIGDGTQIAHGACIYGNTTIGKNNKIFSYAVLGSIPQDLKFDGEDVELIIGDNNTIREFTLFNPGTKGGGGKTVVGSNNLFMGYVHLGHDVIVKNNCILANAVAVAGHVEIGERAVIGGVSAIHQFVHIGDYAMVGGASALSQDLPPYMLAEGNRAKVKNLNLAGLRRHLDRSDIDQLRSAYKELIGASKPYKELAQDVLDNSSNNYVQNLCRFVLSSKRGVPFTRSIKESN